MKGPFLKSSKKFPSNLYFCFSMIPGPFFKPLRKFPENFNPVNEMKIYPSPSNSSLMKNPL